MAPAKNRNATSAWKFGANADKNEKKNPHNAEIDRTFCRPHVSAKKPQKYEVDTIPRNEMTVKTPFCDVVKFKSHCAYVNT